MAAPARKKFREIWTGKDGVKHMRVNYHEGQIRADKSTARYVIMLAGTQGGKTCYGPHWLYDRILETKVKGEDNDYLAITATFPLLKMKMVKEFRLLFENLLQLGVYKDADKLFLSHERYHGAELWRVIFGSATNPESIESATAKAAWLDEAGQKQFKREAWEAIERRLSIYEGRALFTTTLYCLGWLKTEIYDKAMAGDKTFEVISFDSMVNPLFPKDVYNRARATLPTWKFKMFYQGEYDNPAGQIYDAFNEKTCVIDRFPIPKNWLVYCGHDFGGVNPAAVFYAKDPDTGFFYLFDTFRPQEGMSVSQRVERWKQVTEGMTVVQRCGGSHQEEEIRQAYTAHGWPIQEPKIHSVEAGIDKVYALHKLNKIFVFRDLNDYLDEKQSYSRELDSNYTPTDQIEDKSKYHLMDAERYLLSEFTPETADPSGEGEVWKY